MCRKIAKFIFVIGFVLCAVVVSKGTTMDYTLTHRTLLWSVIAFALFVLLSKHIELKHPVYAVFLFYFFTVSYSILFATNKGEAVNQALRVFVMIVYLATAVIALRDNKLFPKVLIGLTIALGLYSIYEIFFTYHTKGLMANKNQCALVTYLMIVLCIHYYRSWKIPSVIAVILGLSVIVMLRTRSCYLALIVSSIVYTVIYGKYKHFAVCSLVPAICCAVFFAGLNYEMRSWKIPYRSVVYAARESRIFDISSMSHRSEMWTQTLKMIKDCPAGIGAGNWMLIYPVYAKDTPMSRASNYNNHFAIRAHNDFLQIGSETGILGLSAYITLFVLVLYYSRGMIRIGLSGFIVISCFTFPILRPFPSILLMIYFAHVINARDKLNIQKALFIPIILILSVCVSIFGFRHMTAEKIIRVYKAHAKNDWDTVMTETENISGLSNIDTYSGTPIAFYRGLAYFFKNDLKNALDAFEDAEKAAPNHLYVLLNLAGIARLNGKYIQSQAIFAKVDRRYPDFPDRRK